MRSGTYSIVTTGCEGTPRYSYEPANHGRLGHPTVRGVGSHHIEPSPVSPTTNRSNAVSAGSSSGER